LLLSLPPLPASLCIRYHYNVSNHRLDVHVSKGFDDGLYISSVCACGDLWAIIMDAGTGFTQQVGDWVGAGAWAGDSVRNGRVAACYDPGGR
jgi:hypothetical protein